jgi:transposase-like protein
MGGNSIDFGCTAETLLRWVRETERAEVPGAEARAEEAAHVKALEREVRELRQTNKILRKASAYFAQAEFDRPLKR